MNGCDRMQRYFVNQQIADTLTISDNNQYHHMAHVMRMKADDQVVVCDHEGRCFLMNILSIDKTTVTLNKVRALPKLDKLFHITLAQALIRKDHFELVCQKATELGVDTIIPIITDRTIVKLDEKNVSKKQSRWQAIIQEASEQSHRNHVGNIESVMRIDSLDYSRYDTIFVAYEKESSVSLKKALKTTSKDAKIMVIIGPEGGFTESEIAYLEQYAQVVTLGPRILRSETAAIFSLAAISYALEMSE